MDPALDVHTIPNRIRIPQNAIQSVVNQIVTLFHPQKIILFGSYAYGTPRPESDVDLLVIMETTFPETELAASIYRQLQYRFGLDLIVITPTRLKQRLEWGDSFLKSIIKRGINLYESPHD